MERVMKAPETQAGRAWAVIAAALVVFAVYIAFVIRTGGGLESLFAFMALVVLGVLTRDAALDWVERGRR